MQMSKRDQAIVRAPALRKWQESVYGKGPYQVPDYESMAAIVQEHEQMAIRIEELSNCVAVLEDNLAKAVEALEKVQAFVRDLEPHADQGHTLVPALRDACATLAELNYDERSEKKGETDG